MLIPYRIGLVYREMWASMLESTLAGSPRVPLGAPMAAPLKQLWISEESVG